MPVLADLRLTVASHRQRTERCARRYVERGRERLEAMARLLPKRDQLLGPQRQRADEAGARLDRGLERRVTLARGGLDRAGAALRPAILERQVERGRDRLASTWRLVQSLNPDRILERGYARITARPGGETLSSAEAARAADTLTLRFRDGTVDVAVDQGGLERPAPKTYDKPKREPKADPSQPSQPTLL